MQRAMDAIREAEQAKAQIYEISGNQDIRSDACFPQRSDAQCVDNLTKGFTHSMMVDETFLCVAAHIDNNLRIKIAKGEYV